MVRAVIKTSYKRECQDKYFPIGSVPTLFCLGIQPNPLNVHPRSTSDFFARGPARSLFSPVVSFPCRDGAHSFL
jgi:hypothetical protein